jgi:steroid delta-isomerase
MGEVPREEAAMASSREQKVAAVEAYVQAFADSDVEAICALYAEDATVEDPVGTPLHVGAEAIRRFYAGLMAAGGARLELQPPVRTSETTAAFAFSSFLTRDGVPMRIDVIDIFEFDAGGKVKVMRAHWGPGNRHEGV